MIGEPATGAPDPRAVRALRAVFAAILGIAFCAAVGWSMWAVYWVFQLAWSTHPAWGLSLVVAVMLALACLFTEAVL